MSGKTITGSPVSNRIIYVSVCALMVASAVLARADMATMLAHPTGIGAMLAAAAGLFAKRSMALTPWALVSAAVMVYGVGATTTGPPPAWSIAQVILLSLAAGVGLTQLKVRLATGSTAARPPRTRWGSVMVAMTTFLIALALSRPDVLILDWVESEAQPSGQEGLPRADFGPLRRTGVIEDPAIIESSGISSSRMHPEVLWTVNDSGNDPRIYCLRPDGAACGTWEVNGAMNVDWEALAIGDIGRTPHLFIGDIGDNGRTREGIVVYAFPEPTATAGDVIAETKPVSAFDLRFPDGPHDAEAMMIHPRTGDLYVMTKEYGSSVYKAEAPLDDNSPNRLTKVAEFSVFANFADVTGGDISPDGLHVAIATYGGWYELSLAGRARFDSIWNSTPKLIAKRIGFQWEGVTYGRESDSVFMTPEGDRTALYRTVRDY